MSDTVEVREVWSRDGCVWYIDDEMVWSDDTYALIDGWITRATP